MALKMHATLEEVTPDEEQDFRALRIAIVSERASSLPSDHLDMWERMFLSIGKGLAPSRGRPEGVYWRRGHADHYWLCEKPPPSGNS